MMGFTFKRKGEKAREPISMLNQHILGSFEEAFRVGAVGITRDVLVVENWG